MGKIGTSLGFCAQTANIWQLVGYLLYVFKIILPCILIVVGIFSLGKAVISDEEKDMKECLVGILKKFVAAVIIFFIPTIVTALFSIVKEFSAIKDDYNVCKTCIVSPNGDYCSEIVMSSEDV